MYKIKSHQLKNVIRKHQFFVLLILNALFFCTVAYFFKFRYEVDDDYFMLLFASGKYSGVCDPHLVFINYIYGLLLTFLYSNYASIEWYTLLFVIIHIFSLSVISWYVFNGKRKVLYKILFIGLIYVIEMRLIMLFQFTTTAAIATLAGVILICSKKWYQNLVGVFFVVIGSLIRFEASLLVLFVVSPFFLKFFFQNNRFTLSNQLVFLIAGVTFSLLFKFIDYKVYQSDPEWKCYQEYNRLRGQINDNPNSGLIINNLPHGINKCDYQLLLNFFIDAKTLNLSKIRLINSQLKHVEVTNKLSNIYPSLRKFTFVLFVICSIWLIILVSTKEIINKCRLIFSMIIFIFAISYVSLDATLKDRVFYSALLPLIIIMYDSLSDIYIKPMKLSFVVFICMFVSLFFYRVNKISCVTEEGRKVFSQQNSLLKEYVGNNKSVIRFCGDIAFEFSDPFSISSSININKIYISDWATNMPTNKLFFYSFQDLINRHSIFLEKGNANSVLTLIKESIFLNYSIRVKSKIEMQSKDYIIVKLYTEKNTL
jgi:hypothetical protein